MYNQSLFFPSKLNRTCIFSITDFSKVKFCLYSLWLLQIRFHIASLRKRTFVELSKYLLQHNNKNIPSRFLHFLTEEREMRHSISEVVKKFAYYECTANVAYYSIFFLYHPPFKFLFFINLQAP